MRPPSGRYQRHYYDCPYCTSRLAAAIDVRGGASQSFPVVCAVCRRVLIIHVALEQERIIRFVAEADL